MTITIFTGLGKRLHRTLHRLRLRITLYIRRLLFPLYLFPLKLVTYSLFYLLRAVGRMLLGLLRLLRDMLVYPFLSFRNLLKSIFILALVLYVPASLFVTMDYIQREYGYFNKFLCAFGASDNTSASVVRVVGGESEGTGFFVSENEVVTNFHVIADEPSPKIILPGGAFVTPTSIVGDREVDLARLTVPGSYPDLVLPLPNEVGLVYEEPLLAVGYALGTELTGRPTTLKGRFFDYRQSRQLPAPYIQTDISLVGGMSGGPLVDQCGEVVGINTMGVAGLSMFISGDFAKQILPAMTDQDVVKIKVDPSISPEEAVRAFYTYLKARRMDDGYRLLSSTYLEKTNYEEWTNRFKDILDVNVYLTAPDPGQPDSVFVKFGTKNWVDGEVEIHFYEGTWITVLEDGVYKMHRSHITEVTDPDWSWFYFPPEF